MVKTWRLVTDDGFGEETNEGVVSAAKGCCHLFVGTWNSTKGTAIYRTADGIHFDRISPFGFNEDPTNRTAGGSAIFNGHLYVSVWNDRTGGQLWRSKNPFAHRPQDVKWEAVTLDGYGDPRYKSAGTALRVVEPYLYATQYQPGAEGPGPRAIRSATGELDDWNLVGQNNFGIPDGNTDASIYSVGDTLIATTEVMFFCKPGAPHDGGRIMTLTNHLEGWKSAAPAGMGNRMNHAFNAPKYFQGHLYTGSWNLADGGSIWRTDMYGDPPWTWEPVMEQGFGEGSAQPGVWALEIFDHELYVCSWGYFTYEDIDPEGENIFGYRQIVTSAEGGKIHKSSDGRDWVHVEPPPTLSYEEFPQVGIHNLCTFKNSLFCLGASFGRPIAMWAYDKE